MLNPHTYERLNFLTNNFTLSLYKWLWTSMVFDFLIFVHTRKKSNAIEDFKLEDIMVLVTARPYHKTVLKSLWESKVSMTCLLERKHSGEMNFLQFTET